MRYLYKLIFKLFSWRFEGSVPKDLPKFIIIVAPHTANIDFFVGIMARRVLQLDSTKYLGKSQLFKAPYGFIFRWLGGYPVDRSKNNNLVDVVVDIFNSKERFSIALAPEGTRKKVDKIKTGFYHIAKRAKIPIIMISFDFGTKKIKVNDPFMTSDNVFNDFKKIITFFSSSAGAKPQNGVSMDLLEQMLPEIEKLQERYSSELS